MNLKASDLVALEFADVRLVNLAHEVAKHRSMVVREGFRDEAEQNKAFAEKKSQKKWPDSLHNTKPCRAIHFIPLDQNGKIPWVTGTSVGNSVEQRLFYTLFAGEVIGIGKMLGYEIRWGGDWDGDFELNDQKFHDLCHYEVIN